MHFCFDGFEILPDAESIAMSLFYVDEFEWESYSTGNSQWYVVPETPMPITQPAGSPVPPPRQRHNPFNKPEVTPHQRSHSVRSMPGELILFCFKVHLVEC